MTFVKLAPFKTDYESILLGYGLAAFSFPKVALDIDDNLIVFGVTMSIVKSAYIYIPYVTKLPKMADKRKLK